MTSCVLSNRVGRRLVPPLALLATLAILGCPSSGGAGAEGRSQEPKAEDTREIGGAPEGPVRIAFVPSVEQGAIEMQLGEFDRKLSETLGHPVESSIVLSYTACVEQMAAGHFEAALLPPLAYVLAHDRYGVEVALKAVRRGSPTYRGEILARVDSGIDSLEDLRGRTFGFTDVSSTSGHLYPKTLLINSGIDPETDLAEVTFVGSQHSAVVEAVLHGRIDAGACFDDARTLLEETEPDVMESTKVIAYTPQIPADTVSLRADCVGPFYDRLVDALMALSREGENSALMRIYSIEELVPAEDSDYDPIRQMVTTLNIDIEAELEK